MVCDLHLQNWSYIKCTVKWHARIKWSIFFWIFSFLLYLSKCIQWSHINCLIAKNVETGAFVLWNMTYAWIDDNLGKPMEKPIKLRKDSRKRKCTNCCCTWTIYHSLYCLRIFEKGISLWDKSLMIYRITRLGVYIF